MLSRVDGEDVYQAVAEAPAEVPLRSALLVLLSTLCLLIVIYEFIVWQPVGSAGGMKSVPSTARAI